MNIISGKAKGHRIFAPDNIRPTRGKVREALFSIINVEGKSFLDLYSGSGAVGLEALSRRASRVVFIERSRKAISFIERNIKKTGLNGEVVNRSVNSAMKDIEGVFDYIFMDPPYRKGLIKKTLSKIGGVMNKDTVIIIECPSDEIPEFNLFRTVKKKVYGDNTLLFLKK